MLALRKRLAGAVMPVSAFAALPGGRLHYLDWGGVHRPGLVFIHANGLNARTYRQLLAPLAGRFRVLAPDLRGHGLTELPADPARDGSWDHYVRDLAALLESRGPAVVAGHSMGGLIALLLAAERPDLVRGVLVAEPVILPPGFYWLMNLRRFMGWRGHYHKLARMAARRRAVWPCSRAVFRAYRGRGAFKSWPRDVLEDYIAHGVRPRSDGEVELSCDPAWEAENFSLHSPGLWRRLGRISCPVRACCGEHNSTFYRGLRGRFIRALPGAQLEEVAGTGHFLPMERPDVIRDGLEALQDEIEAASGH